MEKQEEKIPLKQRKKAERGITLIALVITIIVLLILAGVTIATLTGDNGILTKAGDAKTSTEIGDEKEKVELSAVGALAKDNGGEIKREYLNDELTSYIGTEGTDYTLSETAPFVVKYLDSGRSYVIDENGNVSEYVNIAEYVKIGDYVNYKPDDKADDIYYDKFGVTYSGYANENIGQDDTLKWRVLNINTDGTVDLISDKPTSSLVCFKGARGYNNGVYLLNDYCKTMYSNSSLGAEARSLNIEDIQDKMKVVDEETGKKAYENYTVSDIGTKYGDTYHYSSNKWYPLQWKNDNGTTGESKQETVTSYETEADAKAQETAGDLIVTQTYWYLSASDIQSNFISADTRDTAKTTSMYYELLCNNGSSYYWLASRYVATTNSSYSLFGLRYVNNGNVRGNFMFTSYGNPNDYYYYVRPAVSLKSNIINTDDGYNETTGWSLK